MKKGLKTFLASIALVGIVFLPAFGQDSPQKAYSLEEFLDSIHAYYWEDRDTKEKNLSVTTRLIGEDNLIEIITDSVYDLTIEHYYLDEIALGMVLFKISTMTITDEAGNEQFSVFNFIIKTASEDLTVPKEKFLRGEFNTLQTKFLNALVGHKRLKIRGYINQYGCIIYRESKAFHFMHFDLRVVKIEEIANK